MAYHSGAHVDGSLARSRRHLLHDVQRMATHAQGEQVLLQFRQSPRPVAACQYILEQSARVDARCHAAITLKYAAVREWASMLPQERAHLRSYVLQV